jgi:glyoxylase-like metal-dependent hydrolase (beta-lactamase superfamily II)
MNYKYSITEKKDFFVLSPNQKDILCSSIYIVKERKLMIDMGHPYFTDSLIDSIKKIGFKLLEMKVFLTHLHFYHAGNPGKLFNYNSCKSIYVSEEECESYSENPDETINLNYNDKDGNGMVAKYFMLDLSLGYFNIKPLSSLDDLTRIGSPDELQSFPKDQLGYFVVGHHTEGSTIFVYNQNFFYGDALSENKTLTFKRNKDIYKIKRFLAARRENVHAGHD